MKLKNEAEVLFAKHLTELGLWFRSEVKFHPHRRWRFDFVAALQDRGPYYAIEIDGGIWTQGRHTRGKGRQSDMDKLNHATIMGYRVLTFSTQDVLRGRAKEFLKLHLKGEKP